ncbi:DUF6225 family protein [Actinomadura sp. 3N407]|uniref:DUF6225 family protein n=1 Tax=Actinomadura sp. 3N407 TaxID=3457423 RepID=UPI003FCDF1EB
MTSNDQHVPRATVVPWRSVSDEDGRPAFTAGQLRDAIAGLDDDAPIVVNVATDDHGSVEEQIITGAGYGKVRWGDGYGTETNPLFALDSHWPSVSPLIVRPDRPRKDAQ